MKNNIQNYLNEKLSDITFSDESQAKVMEKIKTLSLNKDKEENTDKVTKEFNNIEKSSVIIEKVEVKDVNKSMWIKYISFAAAFLIIVGSTFAFSKMDSSNNNVGDETMVTTVDFFQTDSETSSVGDEANNDTNESNDFYSQKIENYFIAEQIALNEKYDYFKGYGVVNGKVYIIAQDISGMQIDSTYVLIIMNEDGIEESKIPINPQNEGYINDFTINEDGTISFIEKTSINEKTQSYIHTMDITGAIISTIELKELSVSFENMLIPFVKDKDGNFILAVSTVNQTSGEQSTIIYKVNNSGEILFTIEDKELDSVFKIFKMENGDIILYYCDNFAKVNFENNSIEKDYKFEGLDKRKNYEVISGNDEYELFLTDNMSLFGYNSDEKAVVEIVNYVDSDIEGYVKFAFPVNKDRIICKIYDTVSSSGQKNANFILKRVDSETLKKVQDKQVLTLAGSYIPWYLSSEVTRLNKSNDKFRVKLIDYTKYNTEDDYEAGSKKLNDEILNGNIPDVLILNTMMDTDAYIDKGFLTDMNTFFNSDLDIKKEDYLENIINVFETEGKLYQISPNFLIKAMFGKTSELGENQGWNIEDFNAFLEKNKDKEVVNVNTGGKALLEEILRSTIGEYINYKERTCNFENENFIKLIEGIKKYDENRLESQNEEYNYNTYNSLLNMDDIYSYLQMHQIEKGYIGEGITLKCFPSVTGGCASMDIDFSLAISDKSKNKAAAWEFVKMFLKEDFQNRVGYLCGFPIKKSSLEKLAENTKNPTQDIGSPLIQSGLQVGDEYKEIGFIDDEGIEKVNNLIKSINSYEKYDSEILNIIREELYSFYDGNKTAEEVAKLIQTRISTYINETK